MSTTREVRTQVGDVRRRATFARPVTILLVPQVCGVLRIEDYCLRHLTCQSRNIDEVRLLRVENVAELVDVAKNIVYQVLELVLLKLMLRSVLVLLVFLERYVDQSQESEIHLGVTLKVGPVVLNQLVQGHELVLSSEYVLTVGLDQNVSHGE